MINIIGAGRLGQTLGYLWQQSGLIQVGGVCNQTRESADKAIAWMGAGVAYDSVTDLPAADITLIATPDVMIEPVANALACNPSLKTNGVVLHCSGVLSSAALTAVQALGCYTASVHPMRSFADPKASVCDYRGTYCAVEGDPIAILQLNALFEALGSIMVPIDASKKTLYHAAAVFASNYVITLAEAALQCLTAAGIAQPIAKHTMLGLMKSAVSNLESHSPKDALTGPLKRGDTETITQHLQALKTSPLHALYVIVGAATAALFDLKPLHLDES